MSQINQNINLPEVLRNKMTLLCLGMLLSALSSFRFSVSFLAWISLTPFLLFVIVYRGRNNNLLLLASLTAGTIFGVSKIITPPISFLLIFALSIPIGISTFLILLLFRSIYDTLGERVGVYVLPAILVTGEWLTYSFTESGSWGILALTQIDNLEWLQMSIFWGTGGLSYLIALASTYLLGVFLSGFYKYKKEIAAYALILISVYLFGALRLSKSSSAKETRIAAVSSPIELEKIGPIMNDLSLGRNYDEELFARTEKASDLGAEIIVWNEGSTMLPREAESEFIQKGKEIAIEKKVHIIMAYGILLTKQPLLFENKYQWILPNGNIADTYFKRHPVPGEGSQPEITNIAKAIKTTNGLVTGAICYDYDFPEIARENANSGAGLAVVPSSDWKGIDPIHSYMARYQTIANGISLVRSVRAATSIATDAYGRIRATMRYEDHADGIMLASVPIENLNTFYAKFGDVFSYICVTIALVTCLVLAVKTFLLKIRAK